MATQSAPLNNKKTTIPRLARPQGFHQTGVKRQVLQNLAEYFCLTTNDLVELVYEKQTEPNQASMRRTLQLLHKEKLINKLPYLNLDALWGGRTFAYGLSDKGLQRSGYEGLFHGAKSFDEHSARTLDHELAISRFHIELKKHCARTGKILYWQQRDLKRTVNPDALFALTDPTKPEGANTHYFFLEMERASPGNFKNGVSQIIRKAEKYYSYYNTKACEDEWRDFRQFRVIVIVRNEPRRDHLLFQIAEAAKHRMFWLTTDPSARADIGGEIFMTPRDYPDKKYSFNLL